MSYHVCKPLVRLSALRSYLCDLNFLPESLNYTWINQDRKSVHLPAPTYIDYVMTWVQNLLDDENVFPTKSGV
jgi:hypothetical protein